MLPIPKDKADPLRCFICGKTFEREKSTKRHQFYCRSRVLSATPSPPRKRSCQACTVAKTRCEMKGSTCTRCQVRRLKCELRPVKNDFHRDFRAAFFAANGHETGVDVDSLSESTSSYPDPEALLEQEQEQDQDPDTVVMYKNIAPNNPFNIDWNDPSFMFDMSTPFIPPEASFTPESTSSGPSAFPFRPPPPSTQPAEQESLEPPSFQICNRTDTTQNFLHLTTAAALFAPSPPNPQSQRPFEAKKPKPNSSAGNVAFLMRILCSYPDMMLRRQTFPPFIHPQCTPGEGENETLVEPLTKCMEIAWTFKMRHTFSRNAWWVWLQIRKEHERIWDRRHSNDKWELLASLQSLIIYAIMRIIEGEADYTDFDDLLLVSLNAVNSRLRDLTSPSLLHPSEETGPTLGNLHWKDWLFYESHRRTIAVYRILSLLVSLETIVPCKPIAGLFQAPLPAKKTIWDAQDERSWRAEYELDVLQRNGRPLLTNGDLMRLQVEGGVLPPSGSGAGAGGVGAGIGGSGLGGAGTRGVEGWDEWYAGMDGLGTMVMIASTL